MAFPGCARVESPQKGGIDDGDPTVSRPPRHLNENVINDFHFGNVFKVNGWESLIKF